MPTCDRRRGHNPYRMTFTPTRAWCGDCGTVWTMELNGAGRPVGWRKESDEASPRRVLATPPTYPEELF